MTKEEIYDERIAPLMAQIIDICKAHKIPVLCEFVFGTEGCTTSLLRPEYEPSQAQLDALRLIRDTPRTAVLMVRHG
jgi:hypothetical protein